MAILLIGVVAVVVYTKWFVNNEDKDKMTKRVREEGEDDGGDGTSDAVEPNRMVKRLRTLESSLNIIRKALLDDGENPGLGDTATLDQLVAMRRDIDSLSSKLQTAHGSDENIERIAESIRNVLEDSQQKIREQVERNSKELSEHPVQLREHAAQLVELRKELDDGAKKLSELVLLVEEDQTKLVEIDDRFDTIEANVKRLDEVNEAHVKRLDAIDAAQEKRLVAINTLDASVKRLDDAREAHEKRFEAVDAHEKRLDEHDKRFEAVDAHEKRLEAVDSHEKRLDAHEKRLEAADGHEKRLDAHEKRLEAADGHGERLDAHEKRLEAVDGHEKRLDAHEKRLAAIDGLDTAHEKRLDTIDVIDAGVKAHEKRLEAHEKRLETIDSIDAGVKAHEKRLEAHEKRLETIDAIESDVKAHEKRLDAQEKRLGAIDAIDASVKTHEKRLGAIDAIDASVKAHEKRLGAIDAIDASVKAHEKRFESIVGLDKRLDAISALDETRETREANVKLTVDALKTRADGTDAKLTELEGQIESRCSDVEQALTEYKVQVDNRHASLTKGAEELGLKSNACDKRAEAHEARSAALEKEVSVLRTRTDTCERITNDLESRADKHENLFHGMQKDVHELDKRGSTVEKLAEDTQKNVIKYEERYASLEKNLHEVDFECKARRAICENTAGDMAIRVRECAQQVSSLEVQTAEMKTRAVESDKKIEDLASKVQQHSEQLVVIDAESKTRSVEQDKKAEELSTRTQHHSELLASIEAQTNGLRAELDASSRRLTNTEAEVRDWRHGVDRQLAKIEQVPEQLGTLQRTSAFLSAKVDEHEKRFEKSNEALIENLAEKEQNGKQLERRISGVEQTTYNLRKTSQLHSEQLSKLNSFYDPEGSHNKRITDVVKKTERLTHDVTELQRQSAEMRTQLVSSRETDLNNLRTEIASRLDESSTNFHTVVDTIRKECDKITGLRDDIDGKSDKLDVQKVQQELEARITSIAGQVELAKKTLESSTLQRGEVRALRADLSAQTASLASLRSELAELNLPQIQRATELMRQWRIKTEHLIAKFLNSGGAAAAASPDPTKKGDGVDDSGAAAVSDLTTTQDEFRDENIVSEAVRKISDEELPKLRKALESSVKDMGIAQNESMLRELEQFRKERSAEINSALESQNAARDLSRENALKPLRDMQQNVEETLRQTQKENRTASEILTNKFEAALADLNARRDTSRGKEMEKWRSVVNEVTKKETEKVETKLKDVEDKLQSSIQATQLELETQKQECKQLVEQEQKKTEEKVYAAIENATKEFTASREKDSGLLRGLDTKIKEASSACAEQRTRLRETLEQARDDALLKLAKSRDNSRAKELDQLRIRMEKLCVENLEAALGKLKTNEDAVVAKEIEKLRGEVFKRIEADVSKIRTDRDEAIERNAQKCRAEHEKRVDASLAKLLEERDSSRTSLTQNLESQLKKHVEEELARFGTKSEQTSAQTLELFREEVKRTISATIEKWSSDRDVSRNKAYQQLSAELKKLESEQRKIAGDCSTARKQLHADIQKETKTAYASLVTERDASRTQSLNQLRSDLVKLNEATLGKALSDAKSDLRREISEKSMRSQQDTVMLTKLRAEMERLGKIEGDGSRFLLLDQINQLTGGRTFEEFLQERVDKLMKQKLEEKEEKVEVLQKRINELEEDVRERVRQLQEVQKRVDELEEKTQKMHEGSQKRVGQLEVAQLKTESLLDVSSALNVLKMAFYNVECNKLDDNNNLIVNLLCRDCDMAVLCDMWVPAHRLDADARRVGATDTMLPYLPRQRVHYLAMRTIEAKHDEEAGAGFIMSGLYINPNLNLAITKRPFSVPDKPNGDTCALIVEATLFAKYDVSFVAVFPAKANASKNSCEALVNYVKSARNRVLFVLGDFGTDVQNFQKLCKNTPGLRSEFAFCVNKPLFTSFSDPSNFRHHVHILTNGSVLSFDAKQHSGRTMSVHANVSLVYSDQLNPHKKYGADSTKFHNKKIV